MLRNSADSCTASFTSSRSPSSATSIRSDRVESISRSRSPIRSCREQRRACRPGAKSRRNADDVVNRPLQCGQQAQLLQFLLTVKLDLARDDALDLGQVRVNLRRYFGFERRPVAVPDQERVSLLLEQPVEV